MDHRRKKLQGSLAAARDKPIARPRKLRTDFGFPWDELGVDVSSMGVIDQDKKKKTQNFNQVPFSEAKHRFTLPMEHKVAEKVWWDAREVAGDQTLKSWVTS